MYAAKLPLSPSAPMSQSNAMVARSSTQRWFQLQGAVNESPMATPSRPNRVLRLLAGAFTVAAVGSVVLVAVDMVVGRPAAGDVFITVLNALAAFVLWRRVLAQTRV